MKEEDIKIGDVVYSIMINMPNGIPLLDCEKEGVFIEKLNVVYKTDMKIALSDEWITKLDAYNGRTRYSHNTYLEDIIVNIKSGEEFYSNGIFAKCYTTNEPTFIISKMKRKIIEEVNEKYGFLFDVKEKINNLKIESL